jgi:hypothetical protein
MKIKFISESRRYAFEQMEALKFCLKYNDYGFSITEEEKKADIFICHNNLFENISNYNVPTIIVERTDSSTIVNDNCRIFLENDNVIALFKSNNLKNLKLNNEKLVQKRYHYKKINNNLSEEKASKYEIKEKNFYKIKTLIPLIIQERFYNLKNNKLNYKKKYDLCLVASSHIKKCKFISKHRINCYNKLLNCKFSKICLLDKNIPYKDWIEILTSSRICISPWGFGEMCYRDFESLYCSSILLKPDCSFLNGFPNIYENNIYYKQCNHNFEDLEEIIDEILKNKYENITNNGNILINKFYNFKYVGNVIAKEIKNLINYKKIFL